MNIKCPYCSADIEIEDSEVEYMHEDGYIEDFECPKCSKLFDISVEMVWTGDGIEINNDFCDECGKEFRTRELHYA
jgi:DNA-directed RNA polymerase subunit RPC12/RpoP